MEKCLGRGVDNLETVVVFEGGADVEAVVVAEVLGAAGVDWVVDEYPSIGWAKRRGVAVKGAIVVFPGRDGRSDI